MNSKRGLARHRYRRLCRTEPVASSTGKPVHHLDFPTRFATQECHRRRTACCNPFWKVATRRPGNDESVPSKKLPGRSVWPAWQPVQEQRFSRRFRAATGPHDERPRIQSRRSKSGSWPLGAITLNIKSNSSKRLRPLSLGHQRIVYCTAISNTLRHQSARTGC